MTKLKEKIQLWLTGEAKLAHRLGLTPNQVSALGIILALLSALTYWKWQSRGIFFQIAAPILLLASGFCDALDGAIARLYGASTVFGGYLDSLLDRYADAAVLIGIVVGGLSDPFWGLVTLMGSLLVSYSRARAEAAGIKMETVGIAERAERVLILAVASFVTIAWKESNALRWSIILLAFLTNLTVLQRMLHFKKASKKKETVGVV